MIKSTKPVARNAWKTAKLALISNRGVLHYARKEDKGTSEPVLIIDQQWCDPSGLCYEKEKDYIKITPYHLGIHPRTVTNWKTACEKPLSFSNWWGGRYVGEHADTYFSPEFRFYVTPDGPSCAIVLRFKTGDGHKTFAISPKRAQSDVVNAFRRQIFKGSKLEVPGVVPVSGDDEIKAAASLVNKTNRPRITQSLSYFVSPRASDISTLRLFEPKVTYSYPTLHEETTAMLNEFFGTDAPENTHRKKCALHNLGYLTDDLSLDTFDKLMAWLEAEGKPTKVKETKAKKAEALLAPAVEYCRGTPGSSYNSFLYREGDDVVYAERPVTSSGGWHLLSYNVKTKKRFYAEVGKVLSAPPPTINILENGLTCESTIRHEKSEQHKGTLYLGGSPERIYRGTLVEYMMKNPVGSTPILYDNSFHGRVRLDVYGGSCVEEFTKPVPMASIIGGKKVTLVELMYMIAGGDKLAELLLKANLPHLFCVRIKQMMSDTSAFCAGADDKSGLLHYNQKGKNLEEIFGLSVAKLRVLDAYVAPKLETITEKYYSTSKIRWWCKFPGLSGAELALPDGVTPAKLDMESFKALVELSAVDSSRVRHGLYSAPSYLRYADETKAYLTTDKAGIKHAIETLLKYKNLEEAFDYWRMRKAAIAMAETEAETETEIGADDDREVEVFSAKDYPERPGRATRFIPYFTDASYHSARVYTSTYRTRSESDFRSYIKSEYGKAEARGAVEFVTTDGRLSGALVEMLPEENLTYLHNQLSFWSSVRKDKAREKLFSVAVERVKPLEWRSEKHGLQIVAPKNIKELQVEGTCLSHCVASYVDPICAGSENIMFLRRTDMPEEPFYTVEVLGDGTVRQVHCYRNGDLTEDGQELAAQQSGYAVYNKKFNVVGFLKDWAAASEGRVNADTVKTRYDALCAKRWG